MNGWNVFKELCRFFYRHLQHVVNVFFFPNNFQRLAIKTLAATDFARHVHGWQEVHLNGDQSMAFAVFAAAARRVEAEAPRFVTTETRFFGGSIQITNRTPGAGVGSRV